MLISATGNVNISPAIRVPTRKILIAYSAIALCMYWEIAAAESFAYLPNGYKDCSRCLFPHLRENYGVITERYGEILAAIPYPDQEDDE